MTAVSLLDSYMGAKVGVHVGDSVGARDEGKKPKEIAERLLTEKLMEPGDYPNPWNKRSKKRFPAGMPTDDSDQTAVLAKSLIDCGGLDTAHLRRALQENVIGGKSLLWDGPSTGSGETTKNALSDDPAKIAEAMNNNIGTNGSLMRCVPIALFLHEHYEKKRFLDRKTGRYLYPRKLVEDMSGVTHAHPHAKMACWYYSGVIRSILIGELSTEVTDPGERLDILLEFMYSQKYENISCDLLPTRLEYSLRDEYMFPIDPGTWPARGTAEFSLYAAIWCFIHSTSFEDGIEKAIRIGGDTDTVAAIAGGLLGAFYGYGAIPLEWRQTILGHDVMVDLAVKLYEMNQQM